MAMAAIERSLPIEAQMIQARFTRILCAAAACAIQSAQAASFDCARAGTQVERAIPDTESAGLWRIGPVDHSSRC